MAIAVQSLYAPPEKDTGYFRVSHNRVGSKVGPFVFVVAPNPPVGFGPGRAAVHTSINRQVLQCCVALVRSHAQSHPMRGNRGTGFPYATAPNPKATAPTLPDDQAAGTGGTPPRAARSNSHGRHVLPPPPTSYPKNASDGIAAKLAHAKREGRRGEQASVGLVEPPPVHIIAPWRNLSPAHSPAHLISYACIPPPPFAARLKMVLPMRIAGLFCVSTMTSWAGNFYMLIPGGGLLMILSVQPSDKRVVRATVNLHDINTRQPCSCTNK